MKTKNKSKIISIMIALVMVFTMMPQLAVPVHAASAYDIVLGTDVLADGANTENAQTVFLGEYTTWRVIGYDGDGVACSQDTMTLLEKLPSAVPEKFGEENNHYSKSNLKTRVEQVAVIFSEGEKEGIVKRTLISGGYGGDSTDCIAGEKVENALLWPLSSKEAGILDKSLRKSYSWLRSPGYNGQVAHIGSNGFVNYVGHTIDFEHKVVPAFTFNLKAVLFTSSKNNGKISTSLNQDALTEVGTSTNNLWKLTLKDDGSADAVGNGHAGFTVTDSAMSDDGNTVTFSYSGAATGSNEYISAIIKNNEGKITYYGRIKKCTTAQDTATIDLTNKMEQNDKLYVFNEQYNSGTDYSSALHELPHKENEHKMVFAGFTWTGNDNDGYTNAVANFKCKANDGYTQTVNARVTYDRNSVTPSTCTSNGITPYVASLEADNSPDGLRHEETREANVPKASGAGGLTNKHDYEFTGFTWTDLGTWRAEAVANYVCKRDSSHTYEKTATLSYETDVRPTCTTDGKRTYTATISAAESPDKEKHTATKQADVKASGHSAFTAWTYLDENHHQGTCPSCKETVTVEHAWDNGKVTEPATCTENGKILYTCTGCRTTKEEGIIAGHSYGAWTSISDTQHQRICSLDPTHIETADHTWGAGTVKEAPTCSETGTMLYTCTVCKGAKEETININQNAHQYGPWTNLNTTQHQRVCSHNSSHVETANHSWDAGTLKEPATCYNTGTMLYTCTVCKGTKEETININQNGHQYGAWTNLNTTQHQRVCKHNSNHVEKANHTWDAGKVTKQATTAATGVKTYTCTTCKGTKTESIPKLQDQMGTDGTAVGTGASSQAAEKTITTLKKDADPKGAVFARIQLKSPSQTKTSVKISWKKTSGATKYVIYGNACGTKNKMKKLATVTGTSKNFTKVAGKKVKKGTYYKFMVVALDKNNKVVSTSKMIHVATKGGKVGNHKSVTVKAKIGGKTKAVSKVTLKKGKTLALKTTLNPVSKKTPVKKHVGVRYESSNSKIATVNGSGKITAKAKGTCYIYAYAQNGVVKAVKLTVK